MRAYAHEKKQIQRGQNRNVVTGSKLLFAVKIYFLNKKMKKTLCIGINFWRFFDVNKLSYFIGFPFLECEEFPLSMNASKKKNSFC